MPFQHSDLEARYPVGRIAVALDVELDAVHFALSGGNLPADPAEAARVAIESAQISRRLSTAIADASGTIATAIADQYDWRDVQDHPTIHRLIADRTMYNIFNDVIPEELLERVKDGRATLKRIAEGQGLLRDTGSDDPLPRRDAAEGPTTSGAVAAGNAVPLLRRGDLRGGF